MVFIKMKSGKKDFTSRRDMKDSAQYSSPSNDWHTKKRDETSSNRMPARQVSDSVYTSNPGLGLNIYHNVFSQNDADRYIKILEDNLAHGGKYKWSEAQVTNSSSPIKEARDCVDFKYKSEHLGPRDTKNAPLIDLYDEVLNSLKICIDDYARYWGINVVFYEAFNFVKYEGEGKHFRIHADHGPAYNCTVSAVIYINDDYRGGEIQFPRLDNLIYSPRVGDIAVFPSNFIYEHASLPIVEGTKYSVVVMTDINKLGHREYNSEISKYV